MVKTPILTTGKSSSSLQGDVSQSCQRYYRSCGEDGFTLMELIVVCTLVGIFLTLTLPNIKESLYADELDTAARKIVGTVRELRNRAIRDYKPYWLHFEMDKGRIWYEPDDGQMEYPSDSRGKTALVLPEQVRLKEVRLFSQEETIKQDVVSLWISEQGYMDRMVVSVSDTKNRQRTIMFSPFSGSARVYDRYVEND